MKVDLPDLFTKCVLLPEMQSSIITYNADKEDKLDDADKLNLVRIVQFVRFARLVP